MQKVLFYLNDTTGCSFYRCFMPALWLNKIGIAEAYCSYGLFSKGKKADDYSLFYSGELLKSAQADRRITLTPYEFEKEFEDIDTVIYQRQSNASALVHLRAMKKLGKQVYVEHDDWMFGDTGLHDVNRIYADRNRRELFKVICRESDGIIVSTEFLGELFKDFNDNIIVCPNTIDPELWQWQDVRSPEMSIGFAGSASHLRDFKYVPLHTLIKIAPVRFVGLNPRVNGIEVDGWIPIENYPREISGAFRLGLAPLKRNDFNASRSALKWMEYSMAGICTVAEDFGPYKVIDNGVDGFTINGDWIDTLNYLSDFPSVAEACVKSAQERILSDFSIHAGVHRWQEALTGSLVTV